MSYPHPHYRVLNDDSKYSYELESPYLFSLEPEMGKPNGTSAYLEAGNGSVLARAGYRWDGPSGPVIHTTSWVRAALVHDILYQMMRMGWLSYEHRRRADALMYDLAREDGMPWWRAWYSWTAVRLFGGKYARREPEEA